MGEKGRLGEILIAAGEITPEQLEAGLAEQRETGRPLGMTLVRRGVLDEETLIRRLSKQLSIPMARLRGKRVSPEVVALVPVELAEKHHCFPLFVKDEAEGPVLYLGMEDATNLDAMDDVAAKIGVSVRPVLVATSEIDEAQHRHYADPLLDLHEAPPLAAPDPGDAGASLPPASALDPDESAHDDAPALDPDESAHDDALALDTDPPAPHTDPDLDPDLSGSDFDVSALDHEPLDPVDLGAGDSDSGFDVDLAVDPEASLDLDGVPETAPDLDLDAEPDVAPDLDLDAQQDVAPDLDLDADPDTPPDPPPPESIPQDAILRALSQLLVEKGVITREELIDRVHRESAPEPLRRRS